MSAYYQDKNKRIRIEKRKIEELVKDRVLSYLSNSELLNDLMKTALKHRKIGLPVVASEISQHQKRLEELRKIEASLTEALRNAALSGPDAVIHASKAIGEELEKVSKERGLLESDLFHLREAEKRASSASGVGDFQAFLGAVLESFGQKNARTQKLIIQSLIPKIIVHPDHKLELQVNLGSLGGDCDGRKKVRIPEEWRGIPVTFRTL